MQKQLEVDNSSRKKTIISSYSCFTWILKRNVIKKRYYKRIFELVILETPMGYFRIET